MPPSQLKRLKASLREQGIVGPQKSKKEKKNRKHDNADQRAQKHAALQGIRESFNPFEFKTLARPKKFDVVTSRPDNGKAILGRPGVSKSHGEETRRKTLLVEMQKRKKVGGIVDRRIGENDPTMTLEDKAMARFTREQQKKKSTSVFDLEDGDDSFTLTHGGQSIGFEAEDDPEEGEDYDAASVEGSSDDEAGGLLRRKRRRDSDAQGEDDEGEQGVPDRKKSKAEVMKEVIAKSKLHKYERQQAKEDDDDLREELDKELPDILAALRGHINKPPPPPPVVSKEPLQNDFSMDPGRAALLAGKSREEADKEYDARVRQLMYDQKAKPVERTKTEEEKAKEEAERLKQLEQSRMRRMRGEEESESEAEKPQNESEDEEDDSDPDDAQQFGLPSTIPSTRPEGVEDEDDFLLDDDLIASDSEADLSDMSDEEESEDDTMGMGDDDDEFLMDVRPRSTKSKDSTAKVSDGNSKLAYTYPCPQSHEDLLDVFKDVSHTDIPVVVQRIRALYHAGLHHTNKEKLANFAAALVDHVAYMPSQKPSIPLTIVEQVIRHIHSMSRQFPEEIAVRFRHHLKLLQGSNSPSAGDLAILTAVGTIYPTSDHFHQVVTPAITLMARWMGLMTPQDTKDVATGAYIGALCVKYQSLAKRYIPELVRFTNLCLQSPHTTSDLLEAHLGNLFAMADLWATKTAFPEIFSPTLTILKMLNNRPAVQRLQILINNSILHRRPLELHHHRPLPIKSQVPKFETDYNPDKHYDPDQERREAAKLAKEYRREKKGALRELRKDSRFIAREQLREKKERDARYEEKYRKLIASIQGEEGAEKNAYEREKRARKRR